MLYIDFLIFKSHIFCLSFFFFFNDPATTEIYTLSLHDALPISPASASRISRRPSDSARVAPATTSSTSRSEEHTSELQSQSNLVCRLLLEKKKKKHFNLHACSFFTSNYTQHRKLTHWHSTQSSV